MVNKDWLRIFSPAILVIIFCVIGIVISIARIDMSGGWSCWGVIILALVSAMVLVFDFIVKLVFERRTVLVWLVELGILGVIYLFWIMKFTVVLLPV